MLSADGCLETRAGVRVPAAQRHPHAALAIYLGGRGPVDFIGADHAAAAAGEFVADATFLIGIVAYRQDHARLEDEYRNSRCRPAGRWGLGDVAGIGNLRHFIGGRPFTGRDANSAYGQLRNTVVTLPCAGALIGALVKGVVLDLRPPEEVPIRSVGGVDLR